MKHIKCTVATLVIGFLLVGYFFAQKEEKAVPHDESITNQQALDIAEATFRYQFEHNASGQQQKAPAYFLSLFGKDPDEAFLKRFEGHKPPVQKGSEFKPDEGLHFGIDGIKRVSKTRVEVYGGYTEGNLSASGNRYIVDMEDGKWVITGDTMEWIS